MTINNLQKKYADFTADLHDGRVWHFADQQAYRYA